MTPLELLIIGILLLAWARALGRGRRRRGLSAEYRAYIASAAWQRVRRRELARAGYRCEHPFCRRRRPLHVHHLTYVRLGAERPGDLKVLCAHHHKRAHRRRRAPSLYR